MPRWIRSLKERFKQLQNGRFRFLVAIVGTIQQSVNYRSPVLLFADRDGDWHNCRSDAVFVAPEINVYSYHAVEAITIDKWCHYYTLQRGDIVVDVGAGIGDDTLVFSRLVGKAGLVVAIEANPTTFRCLKKTIALNHLDNVIAINVAASDREGSVNISEETNFLSNNIVEGRGGIEVRACMLDHVLGELGVQHPSLVKLNIEGAESIALSGMQELLVATPNIAVSCHDFKANNGGSECFRTYDRVKSILQTAGYVIRERCNDRDEELKHCIYGAKECLSKTK